MSGLATLQTSAPGAKEGSGDEDSVWVSGSWGGRGIPRTQSPCSCPSRLLRPALSEIRPLSTSEDRLPGLLVSKVGRVRGDGTGPSPGWGSLPSFQQRTRPLALSRLLSDISSTWLYLDQSLEQDFRPVLER